jgi:hypothetical protein
MVNIHSGHADQQRLIDFYREKFLPKVKLALAAIMPTSRTTGRRRFVL